MAPSPLPHIIKTSRSSALALAGPMARVVSPATTKTPTESAPDVPAAVRQSSASSPPSAVQCSYQVLLTAEVAVVAEESAWGRGADFRITKSSDQPLNWRETAARAGPTDKRSFGSTRITGLTPCVGGLRAPGPKCHDDAGTVIGAEYEAVNVAAFPRTRLGVVWQSRRSQDQLLQRGSARIIARNIAGQSSHRRAIDDAEAAGSRRTPPPR